MSFGDRLHRLNFARALPGVDIDTDNVLRETNSDVVSTSTLDPPGDLVFDRSVAFPTSEPRWHRFFVAPNVRRLREDRGWSTADLAGRLGVGRHVVRDYERKRKGATQRQFLWSEIVSLCAVFDATIFDLILPEKGHRTVPSGWEHLPLVIPKVVTDEGSDEMRAHWQRDDRGALLDVLIGPGFEPEHIDALISMKERREERLIEELKNLLSDKEKDQ